MIDKLKYNFANCDVDDVSEYIEIAYKISDYLFRGQPSEFPELSSSLERLDVSSDYYTLEQSLLKQFKARAHHYIPSPPEKDDEIEWLSLIQHHGGPTRLLDFTKSIFVATYFAITSAKKANSDTASVWAISANDIRNQFSEDKKKESKEYSSAPLYLITQIQNSYLTESIRSVMGKPGHYGHKRGIAIIEPFRVNERMVAQQAVFIAPLATSSTFMQNFLFTMGVKSAEFSDITLTELYNEVKESSTFSPYKVIRFNIQKDQFSEIIELLEKMNINEATLFPGLDGFARSLNHTIERCKSRADRDTIGE